MSAKIIRTFTFVSPGGNIRITESDAPNSAWIEFECRGGPCDSGAFEVSRDTLRAIGELAKTSYTYADRDALRFVEEPTVEEPTND